MMIEWIAPPAAFAPGRTAAGGTVHALATTRSGGISRGRYASLNLATHVGDAPDAVAENRRRLAAACGISRVQWLEQVHGVHCVHATPATLAQVPEADACWTDEPGIGVAVLTADCVPVVVADRRGTVVGVAHAGWRGLAGGVLQALLDAMPDSGRGRIAWIGPAIGPRDYEIGEEVAEAVRAALGVLADPDAILRPGRPGKYHLDLFAATERLLRAGGVAEVVSDRLCTFRDPRFYSYRRDGVTGRMATLVWLGEQGG